ncbi:MAG: hypothetical protein D6776_08050 [Planctomycetota bacterium]|nr:MAG: hypothetical protein D6776_08050 [Planctomycetota bacterium]
MGESETGTASRGADDPAQRRARRRRRRRVTRAAWLGAAAAFGLRTLVLGVSCMPWWLALALGRRLGDAMHGLGLRRRTIEHNLGLVYGQRLSESQRQRIARAAQRNLALGLFEILRALGPRRRDVLRSFSFADAASREHARRIEAQPGPVLLVIPHLGNFDLLGAWWCSRTGLALHVVMKPPALRAVFELLRSARERFGFHVVDTGSRAVITEINRLLEAGRRVCMLPDQHAGRKKGVVVEFLGVPAYTYRGPAIAALRHPEARVYVAATWRERDGAAHRAWVRPVAPPPLTGELSEDVHRWTARLSAVMSEVVGAHPESYLWHHRRWRPVR